ncbi:MAG: endolytic transglycosylase MltG [Dehalococcoidia bacterium]|nr:endolytic transglycosylase MltG [Dehalococcoidia bacterium]HRC62824.1 endolytic transglycosylase MltG [Dehalococcoidia bacterium]
MPGALRNPLVLLVAFLVYLLVLAGIAFTVIQGSPDAVAEELTTASPDVSFGAGQPVTFVVKAGISASQIAADLEDARVISDRRRFEALAKLTGESADLKAGCYVFSERTPAAEVIVRLREGITSLSSLAVPEGRRVEEVGAALERAGITTADAWRAALQSAPRDVLPEAPPGDSLNGYLFPATYPVECRADAPKMVQAMLEAFTAEVTPALVEEAKQKGLSLHQVVTLASIVEREAAIRSEQPIIASVFLNRLDEGMPLQADPTVQYAIATANPPQGGASWWKTGLTEADLGFESPYNTYLHKGLPPGPIANPGIDAILAVIRPAKTDYLYFVAKGDGSHAFASTLAEHNANVQRYQLP